MTFPLDDYTISSMVVCGDFTLSVLKPNDGSETSFVRLAEPEDGEEALYPAHFLPVDFMDRFTSFWFAKYWFDNQVKKSRHHPSGFGATFHTEIETWDMYPESHYSFFELKYSDPCIAWIEATRTYGSWNPESGEPGWRLTIHGYPDITLGLAQWDDERGIHQLIEQLKEPGATFTQLSRQYPLVAKSIEEYRASDTERLLRPFLAEEALEEILTATRMWKPKSFIARGLDW